MMIQFKNSKIAVNNIPIDILIIKILTKLVSRFLVTNWLKIKTF